MRLRSSGMGLGGVAGRLLACLLVASNDARFWWTHGLGVVLPCVLEDVVDLVEGDVDLVGQGC